VNLFRIHSQPRLLFREFFEQHGLDIPYIPFRNTRVFFYVPRDFSLLRKLSIFTNAHQRILASSFSTASIAQITGSRHIPSHYERLTAKLPDLFGCFLQPLAGFEVETCDGCARLSWAHGNALSNPAGRAG
jgi:hypothetical protein